MQQAAELVDKVGSYGPCAVAFSAGVDSTVVAKAAYLAHGPSAVAVTGTGPALASGELEMARSLAAQIGIHHQVVPTDEIRNAGYVANAPDRCFHCKTELYGHVQRVAQRAGLRCIVNGANTDDQGDYRPGMVAAADFHVRSPLVECGLNKQAVRQLARYWGLPVWDKPAAPCLASRIAYGVAVTPQRLERIDQAEQCVRALGVRELRVRCLEGDIASIEAPLKDLPMLQSESVRPGLFRDLLALGFREVRIDPDGFRSGSLNEVLPVEVLTLGKTAASPEA